MADSYRGLKKDIRDQLKYVVEDVDGNIIYVGPLYYHPEEGKYKSYCIEMTIATIIMTICSFVCGFMYYTGMHSPFMLPYVVEIILCFMCVWAAASSLFYKEPLRYHQYEGSFGSLPHRLLFTCVAAIAGFAAILTYGIVFGFGDLLVNTVVYLLLRLAVAAMAVIIYIRVYRVNFIKKPSVDINEISLSPADQLKMDKIEKAEREKAEK